MHFHHFFGLSLPMMALIAWVAVTWIKANARRDARSDSSVDAGLAQENRLLRSKIARLEGRLSVAERLSAEPARRLDREIEALRHAN